ncbi:uncharacterized protein MYCFIDRAFT_82518 [Pseudocercospora fijiensis CIRAD86]|uniref:Uncharacterized protein n=1 Tax=Pseudocercospora fijiensis (strain CIRAD86) TaxID=383855 RepID=M3A3U0_PSEFD|nr:uncharacterized protein MYCFIDRAFT_82518 [Pseudocercospora fijiensis CIRAD86]EME85749.1 hypothetical protein MYCFIDRAFT_82518 [Pseudocercospora fijiensis CIRAD86]
MKLSTFFFATTFFLATNVAAAALAEPSDNRIPEPELEQSVPTLVADGHLEIRQNRVYNQDAVTATSEAPVVTTFWQASQVGTSVTYIQVIVTQTFAEVPDQWPSPGVGSIGYGTLVKTRKNKREAEPTGGTPVVLELHTKFETIWLQSVTQVIELHVQPTLPTFPGLGNETVISNDTTTLEEIEAGKMTGGLFKETLAALNELTFDLRATSGKIAMTMSCKGSSMPRDIPWKV